MGKGGGPFRELVASSPVCLILRMGWGKVEGGRDWRAKDLMFNCEVLWLYFIPYTVEGYQRVFRKDFQKL